MLKRFFCFIFNLELRVEIKFALWFILFSCLILVPAGTYKFLNGVLIIFINIIVVYYGVIYLNRNNPSIIEKRTRLGEIHKNQKIYAFFTSITFFFMFFLSGLDYRLNLTRVPVVLQIISFGFVVTGQFIYILTLRQNSFASRVIEIQEKQKVIKDGLYSYVRHPMYLSALLIYIFCPLAMNSFIGLLPMIIFPYMLNYRMKYEEKLLEEALLGYSDYLNDVKYRVIPYIW